MKIGFITNAAPTSGVGYYAHYLRQALQKLGSAPQFFDVHVGDHVVSADGHALKQLTKWPGPLSAKSIGWVRLGSALKSALTAESLDVVHITNQTLSFLAPSAPTILTVHDVIEMQEPQDKKAYWLNRFIYRGIPSAQHIIAVSEFAKRSIQDFYAVPSERITVIPNGVGSEFTPLENFSQQIGYQALCRKLKIAPGVPIVLFVGSEHPRKQIDVALKAFAGFLRSFPQAVFIKVGEAGILSQRAVTLDLVAELKLTAHVRFLPQVSYEELNELYNLATVLLFPSRLEGFGLPPLQAMAAGLPVITSNAASLPEVVGEAGIMCDPADVPAFSTALLKIVSDPSHTQSLRAAGLQRAKLFNWDVMAQKTYDVYCNVAKQV